ncbi:Scr1 family TA system antitoxin-like transcriptional regulator [Nocardia flavorosea]|uniref:Scr1 family TA system antitoxin-like transcriptional regulator n=1 Tax=Nocardia TaxID=1817 RepID=UPI003A5CE504
MRLNRQRIITRRRNPVEVDLLLDESALRRVVGSPKVPYSSLRLLDDHLYATGPTSIARSSISGMKRIWVSFAARAKALGTAAE